MALHHKLLSTLSLISSFLQICIAIDTDTITPGKPMNFSEHIVSASGTFELGFFSPGQSKLYLAIWYKKISTQEPTVVWIANRQQPLNNIFNSSTYLSMNQQGNLLISDGKGMSYLLTSLPPSTHIDTRNATLLDSGNFIIRDSDNGAVMWQSFDYPMDTFLPGMKLGFNSKTGQKWSLTSWTSKEDPSPGVFTLLLDSSLEFLIRKGGSQTYWTSGRWNGQVFGFVPEMRLNYIYNYSYISNENGTYFTYSLYDDSVISRLVMSLSGQAKMSTWLDSDKSWAVFWAQPRPQCLVYAFCGAFSICNEELFPFCQCLQGFEPRNLGDWSREKWSAGCMRRTRLDCVGNDQFLPMSNVKFPVNSESLRGVNTQGCKLACLSNCSCTAYAYTNNSDCFMWKDDLIGIEQKKKYEGNNLFIRIAASELRKNGDLRKRNSLLIMLPIIMLLLVLSLFANCLWRRKLRQGVKKDTSLDLLSYDFNAKIEAPRTESSNNNKILGVGKWEMELPCFSLESICASTENFSDVNKLGQGGFGSVYKGKLLNGQEVAIKRLSRGSGQGMEELKNEATLIAKLQHRNLVRLLGCCIEGEEKILIYEYMPNKSLDFFLFDTTNRSILDWKKRVHIIEGIAQGLLYLHQHSRLRIIHRDLKASNILLDNQMNNKISDFGMARMFGGNESQGNTNRIVGTYGYMSPEYVTKGHFSIKSDVFSFGILLLEILSGMKNASFHLSDSLHLIGHAWNLWENEKGLEVIDPMLKQSFSMSRALRYINVALLCVQEQAKDRPTMSDVVMMLSNEVTILLSPNPPGFYVRSNVESNFSMNKHIVGSVNNVTVTELDGR